MITQDRRPRIAMATPLNPQASGITDYSEELAFYLRRKFDVDLFSEEKEPSNPEIIGHHEIHPLSTLGERADDYCHIIYQIGNSDLHYNIFQASLRSPGVVILHDYDIQFAVRGEMTNEAALDRLFCRSKGIIVHNEHSRAVLKAEYPAMRIARVPQLLSPGAYRFDNVSRSEARTRLGIPENAFLAVCLGRVQPHKRVHIAIQGFAQLAKGRSDAVLIVGGEIPDDSVYGQMLRRIVWEESLDSRVQIRGELSDQSFYDCIRAADVGINLRYPSRGEESFSLTRMLGLGLPVIVSNYAQYATMPDQAVMKIGFESEVKQLGNSLLHLYDNREECAQRGEYALRTYRTTNSPDRVVQKIAQFLVEVSRPPDPMNSEPACVLWEGSFFAQDAFDRELACALDRQGVPIGIRPREGPLSSEELPAPRLKTRLQLLQTRVLNSPYIHVYSGEGEKFRRDPAASWAVGLYRGPAQGVGEFMSSEFDEIWTTDPAAQRALEDAGMERVSLVSESISQFACTTLVSVGRNTGDFVFEALIDWDTDPWWKELALAFGEEFPEENDVKLVLRMLPTLLNKAERQSRYRDELEQLASGLEDPVREKVLRIPAYEGRFSDDLWGYSHLQADALIDLNTSRPFSAVTAVPMAVGIPLIARRDSRIAGPLWKCAGVLFAQAEADRGIGKDLRRQMRKLASDRMEAQRLGVLSRMFVLNNFTFEKVAQQLKSRILERQARCSIPRFENVYLDNELSRCRPVPPVLSNGENDVPAIVNLKPNGSFIDPFILAADNSDGRRPIFIWGAGSLGQKRLALLKELGVSPKGFIDISTAKQNTTVAGLAVYDPCELTLLKEKGVRPYVLIGSMFTESIIRTLDRMGFVRERDYTSPHGLFGETLPGGRSIPKAAEIRARPAPLRMS
jgi:glycosyltransferase involved in cell wall biosynthesis